MFFLYVLFHERWFMELVEVTKLAKDLEHMESQK